MDKIQNTTELWQSLIQGLKEAVAYKQAKLTEADGVEVFSFTDDGLDIKEMRTDLGLTQQEFATFINSSVRAVQHWEQNTRQPEGPTRYCCN